MESMTDAAMERLHREVDSNDGPVDTDDLWADLDEAATEQESCPAEELGSMDYALPPAVRPVLSLAPRSYQVEALNAWLQHQGCGVVVLPTGAGKTVVALMAIERLAVRTLIVVPTIELLTQWQQALGERLGLPAQAIGVVGGGQREVRDLTIITFDSAAMPRRRLDGFGMLIVDEVHHLPADHYRRIVTKVAAPCRLGLSATPERLDGRHHDLDELIGPLVFHRLPSDLRRERHIADYVERRIFVDLSPVEQGRYGLLMAQFRWYLARHRLGLGGDCFTALVRRTGYDQAARQALQAHRQARMIALNADAKLTQVARLLAQHRDDRVIIFAEHTALVDAISRRLLIPSITYRTAAPGTRAHRLPGPELSLPRPAAGRRARRGTRCRGRGPWSGDAARLACPGLRAGQPGGWLYQSGPAGAWSPSPWPGSGADCARSLDAMKGYTSCLPSSTVNPSRRPERPHARKSRT